MTIDVESTVAKIVFGIIVIACGALGGLAAELLRSRKIAGNVEGGVVESGKRLTARYYDWGTPAALVLGAIVAGVAVGIFDPINEVTEGDTTRQEYEFWQVFALGVVSGFSAEKFLALTQERFLALLTSERMESQLASTTAVATAFPKTVLDQARAIDADTNAIEAIAHAQTQALKLIEDSADIEDEM